MNTSTEPGHGHSPAAWAAVIVMLASLSVATVAFFLGVWWLVVASGVATLMGWGLGFVLSAAGWGVNGPKYLPREHS
jgi:hypothetical protein